MITALLQSTRTHTLVCILMVLCASPSELTCQSGPTTSFANTTDSFSPSGSLFVSKSDPVIAKYLVTEPAIMGQETTVTLPFDVPGRMSYLGGGRFIVPGHRASDAEAFLVILNVDAAGILNIESSHQYGAQWDPSAVFWNAAEGVLYVYAEAQQLLVAPFNGTQLPDSVSFLTVAVPAQLPALSSPPLGLKPFVDGTGVEVRELGIWPPTGFAWHVHPTGAGWSVTNIVPVAGPGIPQVSLREDILDSEGPIEISNVVGTVNLTEKTFGLGVIAQATLTDPAAWVPIALPAGGLLPGLVYALEPAPGTDGFSTHWTGLVRHGFADRTDEVRMPAGEIDPSGCWLGNSEFSLPGWTFAGSELVMPATMDYYLYVGVRSATGVDPVSPVGQSDQYILNEVVGAVGPMRVVFKDGDRIHTLSAPLPIPNDSALFGAVLLWQWATVTPSQQVTVSEVFGAMVTNPWPGADASAGTDGSVELRGIYPKVTAKAIRAAKEWLQSTPSTRVTARKLAPWSHKTGIPIK